MEYYNKEDDVLTVNYGKIEHSRELEKVKVVIDFDKYDRIVGVEIFDFKKRMEETQKKIDRIFRKKESEESCRRGKEALRRLRLRNG